jgi:hypothetical protein
MKGNRANPTIRSPDIKPAAKDSNSKLFASPRVKKRENLFITIAISDIKIVSLLL